MYHDSVVGDKTCQSSQFGECVNPETGRPQIPATDRRNSNGLFDFIAPHHSLHLSYTYVPCDFFPRILLPCVQRKWKAPINTI